MRSGKWGPLRGGFEFRVQRSKLLGWMTELGLRVPGLGCGLLERKGGLSGLGGLGGRTCTDIHGLARTCTDGHGQDMRGRAPSICTAFMADAIAAAAQAACGSGAWRRCRVRETQWEWRRGGWISVCCFLD